MFGSNKGDYNIFCTFFFPLVINSCGSGQGNQVLLVLET